MTATQATETVTIGRITYTVERDVEEMETTTQLGWLHGPRGDLAMVIRTSKGALLAMGSKTIDRLPAATVRAALAPIFKEA